MMFLSVERPCQKKDQAAAGTKALGHVSRVPFVSPGPAKPLADCKLPAVKCEPNKTSGTSQSTHRVMRNNKLWF